MPYTFLIVDDSATTRAFIRRTLGMAGFEDSTFLEAQDGLIGLGTMVRTTVDIVIADLHMPNMDGVQMTRRMQANPKLRDIPVLVVSADPNKERLDGLLAEGVRGYVRKPFTPEAFRSALNNILGEAAHA